MRRIRTALSGLILCIMIAATGCAGQNTEPGNPAQETEAAVFCMARVTLEGGSGKASVDSPCPVYERGGELFARITWSSSHYDFMLVDGEKLLPVNTEGNSQFEIPLPDGGGLSADDAPGNSGVETESPDGGTGLPEDCAIDVQADTTAMSEAHLIDYRLTFRFYEEGAAADGGAGQSREETEAGESVGQSSEETTAGGGAGPADDETAPELPGLSLIGKDRNEYAECFTIYRYEGDYAVLSVDDGRRYLIVPEGKEVPASTGPEGNGEGSENELILLRKPLDRIYLPASAVMCQLDAIGAVKNVILSGLPRDSWYIEAARDAMDSGAMQYGGKYSEPDYEKILSMGTNLAIESTMILHTPKVQEKLEKLGVPVLIDRSSYESEPLGRAEWVKVYGLLTGREEDAEKAFEEQKGFVEEVLKNARSTEAERPEGSTGGWSNPEAGGSSGEGSHPAAGGNADTNDGKTVSIFSVNSNRQVVTRTPGDYFAKMLETAGGQLCTPATDQSRATQTVSMESFYAAAAEADILIYNASIEDAPESLEEMCGKDNILTEFRAVREGRVWCMRSSLYQNASRTGAIIRDLHAIVAGSAEEETEFFYRLK